MKIRSFFALALVASFAMVGCADPCGDLKACCEAQIAALELDEAQTAIYQAVCDGYDNADSDACQAVIDAGFTYPEGVEAPAECEF